MNPFISKLLVVIARKRLEAKHNTTTISKKQVVPLVRILQVELSHAIKEYIFIIIGVFSAGFGLKGFLLPNNFIGAFCRNLIIFSTDLTLVIFNFEQLALSK